MYWPGSIAVRTLAAFVAALPLAIRAADEDAHTIAIDWTYQLVCEGGRIDAIAHLGDGVILAGSNVGFVATGPFAVPCKLIVVPWGIDPMRAIVDGSFGLAVCGT